MTGPDAMQALTERITAIITEHDRSDYWGGPEWDCGADDCTALGNSQEDYAAHVTAVLIAELGLKQENRHLADGYGGISTNYRTGETTVHGRPCTVESRWVTGWERDQ